MSMGVGQAFAGEKTVSAGMLVSWTGDVQIVRSESETIKVKGQETVYVGDAVVTADGARAKLFMKDDSVLSLAPKTTVEVTSYVVDTKKRERSCFVKVKKGSVRAVISALPESKSSDVSVGSEVSSVVANGADFAVTGTDADAAVVVFKGKVAVTSSDPNITGGVMAAAGTVTEIKKAKAPSEPAVAAADKLSKAMANTEISVTAVTDKEDEKTKGGAKGKGK
ncbi:MAG: FecR family protein [Deltaproteobacteria bacterium]|nr:FecR family protein [Deltaproteobacteria bacterium]